MAVHRCFFFCLFPLASQVWSAPFVGPQWHGFASPLAESQFPSKDNTDSPPLEGSQPQEPPLQSESVPLPKLKDGDSVWDLLTKKPTFDVVPLSASKSKRQKSRPKTQSSKKRRRQRSRSGTRFDLRAPCSDRITQWFGPSDEKESSLFNHQSVGMTNPVVGVGGNSQVDYDAASLVTSTTPEQLELEDSWIPATSTSEQEANHWARVLQYKLRPQDASSAEKAWFPATHHNSKKSKREWRECRFKRRVGQGQACYERVREAALDWKFQHNQHEGILSVGSSGASSNSCFSLTDGASQKVQPLWSGPHTGASRRLVTYTTTGFKSKWLPKLYTFNPVMVVYDLLDQRGQATTYSSTAYATLKGHLLSGEERVTVAMRDGTGCVDVEILSYSRPAESMRAKLVWPLIGRMQQRFFEHQMDYLEGVALPNPPPPPPAKSQMKLVGESVTP